MPESNCVVVSHSAQEELLRINRLMVAGATVAVSALALSGCALPHQSEIIEGTSITVAWNDPFQAYNTLTADSNATANANISYLANSTFSYYNNEPKLVHNEDFGKYEITKEDPLTVKYTVNKGVKWSDGTPVDGVDLLMAWAATTTHMNSVMPESDPETGEVTNQDAVNAGTYWNSGAVEGQGLDLVSEVPTLSDDNRSLTIVYDAPYVDWEVGLDVGVSAHGTVQLAYPNKDYSGEDAKDAFVKAVQDKDFAWLKPVAASWNDDYKYVDMPTEPQKTLSNGAYTITDLKKDQYVTLTANPDYTWGPSPKYEKITVRFIADPQAQIQALENGDVQIASAQPTADLITQLKGMSGVEYVGAPEATYEHIDMQTTNGGPFDAATYGGDKDKAKKVRQAFLKTIPRQEIVDKLIKPLQEDAVIRESNVFVPGSEGYKASEEVNGYKAYDEVDTAGAKALLAEAGVTAPVDVRFIYGEGNTRRAQEYELIRQSAKEVGFNLIDGASGTWGNDVFAKPDVYDAALFGWQSTSLAVGESAANYQTGGANNPYGWSNPEIDELFKQLDTETDTAKQQEILVNVEKLIVDEAWTVPIFQFPGVTAWNDKITGVSPSSLSPTYFWNFWEWAPTDKK